jgi:hypothetical protein
MTKQHTLSGGFTSATCNEPMRASCTWVIQFERINGDTWQDDNWQITSSVIYDFKN